MPIASNGDSIAKVFRWTARVLSTLVITYALLMVVASAGFDDTGTDLGIILVLCFMVPTMIALVLSWRWEKQEIQALPLI